MADATMRMTLSLIGPGIFCVFGAAFVGAWLLERRRRYHFLLATACWLFALGALSQITHWPPDAGINALLSGSLYTLAVILACEGILQRSHKSLGLTLSVGYFITVLVLLWFFFYVERSLIVRVYIQNFGYGLAMVVTAWHLRSLAKGRHVDRILFWVLLLFGAQFFPRTLLTIGFSAPTSARAFGETPFWQVLQLSLAVLGAALAFAILAAAITDLVEDLRRERDVDRLTGVLNRRGFEEQAATLFESAPTVVVLCDLDHFKGINDAYGHDAGDEVLQRFGHLLQRTARAGDLLGRIGGEEFAVLLADTGSEGAFEFAERLRSDIAAETFSFAVSDLTVTVSLGIARSKAGDTLHSMIKRADRRLYEAKSKGRNRLIGFNDEAFPPHRTDRLEPGLQLARRRAV